MDDNDGDILIFAGIILGCPAHVYLGVALNLSSSSAACTTTTSCVTAAAGGGVGVTSLGTTAATTTAASGGTGLALSGAAVLGIGALIVYEVAAFSYGAYYAYQNAHEKSVMETLLNPSQYLSKEPDLKSKLGGYLKSFLAVIALPGMLFGALAGLMLRRVIDQLKPLCQTAHAKYGFFEHSDTGSSLDNIDAQSSLEGAQNVA